MMKQQNILIIFAKNLVYGKVKTRLAATIGPATAFEVYKDLVFHTYAMTQNAETDKVVYFSEYIPSNDIWSNDFSKRVQQGVDLGERMKNAFADVFQSGYSKAVIIGTDCPGLDTGIIHDAFQRLDQHEIVIGPAYDGGYYLLGMKMLHGCLFDNIKWSTTIVFEATITKCSRLKLSYSSLQALHDVDEAEDMVHLKTGKT